MASNRHTTTVEVNADISQAESGLQRLSALLDQINQKAGNLSLGIGGGGGGGVGGGTSGTALPQAPATATGSGGGTGPAPQTGGGGQSLSNRGARGQAGQDTGMLGSAFGWATMGGGGGGIGALSGALGLGGGMSYLAASQRRILSAQRGGTFWGAREAQLEGQKNRDIVYGAAAGAGVAGTLGLMGGLSAAGPPGWVAAGIVGLGALGGWALGESERAEFEADKPGMSSLMEGGPQVAERTNRLRRLEQMGGRRAGSKMFRGGRSTSYGPGGYMTGRSAGHGEYWLRGRKRSGGGGLGMWEHFGQELGLSAEQAIGGFENYLGGFDVTPDYGGAAGIPHGADPMMDVNRLSVLTGVDPGALGKYTSMAQEVGRSGRGGFPASPMGALLGGQHEAAIGTMQGLGLTPQGVSKYLERIANATGAMANKGVKVDSQDMLQMYREIGGQLIGSADPGVKSRWGPQRAMQATGITQGWGQGPMQKLMQPFGQIADWKAFSAAQTKAGPGATLSGIIKAGQAMQGRPTEMLGAMQGLMGKEEFALAYGAKGLNVELGEDLYGLAPGRGTAMPGFSGLKTTPVTEYQKAMAKAANKAADQLDRIHTILMNVARLWQKQIRRMMESGVSGAEEVFGDEPGVHQRDLHYNRNNVESTGTWNWNQKSEY